MAKDVDVDLLVIGGGVNGAGIARDATGRGLSVVLVERDDLAAHTSSSSTKLIHGGLRYLEYYEFRLVREALAERETLLGVAPNLIKPMRFVMPMAENMRPAWLIRAGLFLYDHIGGRNTLPKSKGVRLQGTHWGAGLKDATRGFVYSDGWVDDARLVALNAVDAAERGADVRLHTSFERARREGDRWVAALSDDSTVRARAIANTAGPWVGQVLGEVAGAHQENKPRLVKGSHIIVPRLFEGEHAYILQNPDKRIVFAIPYEGRFTLIGTTDKPFEGDPSHPTIDPDETAYLCESVNRYFARAIGPDDVVHSYSGVRPLYDDGHEDASAVTRDYVLKLGGEPGGPQLLSAFGGKITTYRRLSEHALEKLKPFLPHMGRGWTAKTPLPGGDLPDRDFDAFVASVQKRWPFLDYPNAYRMARAYGTRIATVLGEANQSDDLGAGLLRREVDYLIEHEFARSAEDILWRRTKLGLHGGDALRRNLESYLAERAGPARLAEPA